MEEEQILQKELERLLIQEHYWWQRSKINWLQLGDRNTTYFHYKTSRKKEKT